MGPIPKSSFIGVSWRSKEKKWKAQIGDRNGKSKYMGVYDTDIDAARAVNRFCIKNNLSIRNPTILSVLSDPKNEPQIEKLDTMKEINQRNDMNENDKKNNKSIHSKNQIHV